LKASPTARPKSHSTGALKLSIPFYRQAFQFTCGPACLMMAMKFFQPSLRLSRELELDIWREANFVEAYGTSKEGLALAAARRGFHVYTMGMPLRHSFVDAIADKNPSIDYTVLELLYGDTRKKFRAMGLRNINSRIQPSTLKEVLRRSHVPILLTSTSLFGDKEALPHWIVLTGYGREGWHLNNPLAKSGSSILSRQKLLGNLGYQGIQCAIIVLGLKMTDG